MRFLLALIGAVTVIVGIVAAGFFFLGFYNIGASQEDPAIVTWALPKVREASIDRNSAGLAPPMSLDDATVVQSGAKAYAQRGCVNCHGGPGADWAKFSEGLRPDPPDLKDVAGDEPRQLFWVIKNGINMTGMPSFGKVGVEDKEIWSIVAFIKKLPTITPENYKAWSAQ